MIDPVTGMVVANVTGGFINAIAGKSGADDTARIAAETARRQIEEQRQAYNDIKPLYDPYVGAGEQALSDLQDWDAGGGAMSGQVVRDADGNITGLKQFDGSKYGPGAEQMAAYMDPSTAYQQDQMARQVQASAMGRGSMLSGSAMKALQDRSAQLAQTDYANAYNRMNTDKNFAYTQYLNDFTNSRAVNQDTYNQLTGLTNVGQNAVSGMANLRTGNANQVTAAIGAEGAAQAASASSTPAMIQGFGNAVGTAGDMYAQQTYLDRMFPDKSGQWNDIPNPAGWNDPFNTTLPKGNIP